MIRKFAFLLGLIGPFSGVVAARAGEQPLAAVIRSANRATVEILVDGQLKGGGAFVSNDGLLVTAAHLFARPDARLAVITSADERLAAELVAFDKGHDLALLRVPAAKGNAQPFLEIADTIPSVGSRIFNLGSALRLRASVIDGMVSQDQPIFSEYAESHGYVEHYLVSAMTPSLTSGGVWIDRQGRIVGLQNGRLNDGKLTSGLAIVTPPQAIATLVTTRKTASTPDIGAWIWEAWTADKDYLASIPENTEGLVITWLREDGPLATAGSKRLDTIIACNGKPVRRRPEFLRLIRSLPAGETITLTIIEQNKEGTKDLKVKLECQEEVWRIKASKNNP